MAVLTTEGIKCGAAVFGKVIEGKRAFWLFVGTTVAMNCISWETMRTQWYFIHMLAQWASAIGIYSFIVRLYKAIERKP